MTKPGDIIAFRLDEVRKPKPNEFWVMLDAHGRFCGIGGGPTINEYHILKRIDNPIIIDEKAVEALKALAAYDRYLEATCNIGTQYAPIYAALRAALPQIFAPEPEKVKTVREQIDAVIADGPANCFDLIRNLADALDRMNERLEKVEGKNA